MAVVWISGTAGWLSTAGRFTTWKVKSTSQVWFGPPTAPSTTGLDGVKVTTPLGAGAEIENDISAQAVPARPVAVGLSAKTPGSGTEHAPKEGLPHDGTRLTWLTVMVPPASFALEEWVREITPEPRSGRRSRTWPGRR